MITLFVRSGQDWRNGKNGVLVNKELTLLYVALTVMKFYVLIFEQELVRAILLSFFGCKHLYEAFAIAQVGDERLMSFREGDEEAKATYGPKLRNSRLDKRGNSTTAILDSEWNQMVIYRLAEECAVIASCAKDTRFGKEKHDWSSMLRKRLQPILKTHLEAQLKFAGESAELRIRRVAERYRKIKMTSKANNILHTVNLDVLCLFELS